MLQSANLKLVSDEQQFSQTSNAIGVQNAKRGIHPLGFMRIDTAGSGTLQIQVRGSSVTLIYGFFTVCGESQGIFYKSKIFQVFHLFC